MRQENGSLDVAESGREEGNPDEHSRQFTAQYAPAEGWSVTVTIRPSNGFISLNDAGVESLTTLFAELGGLEVADASRMAQGVEDYRYQYPRIPLPRGATGCGGCVLGWPMIK